MCAEGAYPRLVIKGMMVGRTEEKLLAAVDACGVFATSLQATDVSNDE